MGVNNQLNSYASFQADIKNLCNIDLSLYKEKQMKRRINSLMKRNGISNYKEYYKLLLQEKDRLAEFLDYITINVSEFFRNKSQWYVLEEKILPEIFRNKSKIKVWSSACASGEEPYSLALLFDKLKVISKVQILATDIDKKALKRAKVGIYNEKSLINVPNDMVKKYFTKIDDTNYRINDYIKDKVDFKQLNLLEDSFPSKCDLILSRNVMIYFTEEAKEKLYKKFYDALANKGIFFVGSTEQIIMPQKYGFISMKNFFYQKEESKS